jgi:hypothetical protein
VPDCTDVYVLAIGEIVLGSSRGVHASRSIRAGRWGEFLEASPALPKDYVSDGDPSKSGISDIRRKTNRAGNWV